MAASLARAGYEVAAWNRTGAKAERLAAEETRVSVADTPDFLAEARQRG